LVGYAASFGRNIILARVLSKADFGVAAAISLTVTAFEISSKMSIGQQVVQSRDGENPKFLANAHLCQFLMGLTGAVLLACFGGPMADLFKIPQAKWAFVLVSLLGLLNGLQNLDVMRAVRSLDFKKRVLLDVVPEILLLGVCFPVALWFRDYRALVCLLLLKACFALVISHLLAERSYRWEYHPGFTRNILVFGWPLLLNSFLMFGYQQGDQLLIGANYSMAELGLYSIAVSLTMVPGYMFQYVVNAIMLPLLSRVQDQPAEFRKRYLTCAEISTAFATILACGLIIGGELLVTTAYGHKYAGAGAVVAWLAAANALRIIRAVPTLAAMARGDTVNNLLANLFRVSSLIFAWLRFCKKLRLPRLLRAVSLASFSRFSFRGIAFEIDKEYR
jgi:O-antigen/teichoic acid export membrane protein